MDCEKFDRVVLGLLYDELDEITRSAAHRHVDHCTRCGRIYRELQVTRSVARLPWASAPEGLELLVTAAERDAIEHLPLRRRIERTVSILAGYAMRPQLAMGALLLLLIGSSLLFLRGQPGNRERVNITERGIPETEPESIAIIPQTTRGGRGGSAVDNAQAIADQQLDKAWNAYYEGHYSEAQQRAEALVNAGGQKVPEARLLVAQAIRKQSGCQLAIPRFDEIQQRYWGTSASNDASLQAAECYRSLGNRERARQIYEALTQQPNYRERASTALSELNRENTSAPATRPPASAPGAPSASPP